MSAKYCVGQTVKVFRGPMSCPVRAKIIAVERGEDDYCYTVKARSREFVQCGGFTNIADFGEDHVEVIVQGGT